MIDLIDTFIDSTRKNKIKFHINKIGLNYLFFFSFEDTLVFELIYRPIQFTLTQLQHVRIHNVLTTLFFFLILIHQIRHDSQLAILRTENSYSKLQLKQWTKKKINKYCVCDVDRRVEAECFFFYSLLFSLSCIFNLLKSWAKHTTNTHDVSCVSS